MPIRNGLLGLAALLAAVAVTSAKPPELPIDPRVQGLEPTPLAREFHVPEVPPVALGALRVAPARPVEITSMAEMVSEMQEAAFDRITVPLGTVPVIEKK